jgi:hypothetical protein
VGPRAGLDGCGQSRPHRDSIAGPSSPQSVAIPTELPGPRYYNIKGIKEQGITVTEGEGLPESGNLAVYLCWFLHWLFCSGVVIGSWKTLCGS